MGFEAPEITKAVETPHKEMVDVQEKGKQLIDAATTGQEKTKKFEGLTKEQEIVLKAHGVTDIRPDKSPKGHDSTALRFSPNAEIAVRQANGRWISVPNTTVAHITHFDTANVEVVKEEDAATITIHNKDGSTDILRTWLRKE